MAFAARVREPAFVRATEIVLSPARGGGLLAIGASQWFSGPRATPKAP
jgi:hypothetical protein